MRAVSAKTCGRWVTTWLCFGVNQVYQTSIFHWNGTAWSVVPSPDVNQENNYLWSVAGASATDAWAVGFYDTGTELKIDDPALGRDRVDDRAQPELEGPISTSCSMSPMVSPTDVWAVGQAAGFFTFKTLTDAEFTASCGTNTAMHVANIAPSLVRNSVRAAVTIADSNGAPIGGASVTVAITKPNGSQVTRLRSTNPAWCGGFLRPGRTAREPIPSPSPTS